MTYTHISSIETTTQPTLECETKSVYRSLSLPELVKRIVDESDRLALREFHDNRTLFTFEGARLKFADYLSKLRKTAGGDWRPNALEVADLAYDLTLDEFNNIPSETERCLQVEEESGEGVKREEREIDCRFYFRAFLKRVDKKFKSNPPVGEIEEELKAARIMQGFVRHCFRHSVLEARRRINHFWSRYNWEVKGGKICVWLPKYLNGRERRPWLKKNISGPNPQRPGERERIQKIIDQKFVNPRFVGLDEARVKTDERPEPCFDSGKPFGTSLAEAVAEEKAVNIGKQRRSIRLLGREKLKTLILRVFDDIDCGSYKDGKVARDFGISKATFSRFAGSEWHENESAIPDLWRNTANVLSTHDVFKEVAVSTGMWDRVQETLNRAAPRGEEVDQS